ncbi:MAG: geranylgeranylglycerol-phosphate geranylgeranyltransferase [Bacteroidetes bacterium]|nr:geranylgeranylglycerol-phosphate geranylgeranyltransferase [Bacteroidota bacterium]
MPEKNPTESKWKAWLLLMRWRNLLIIALTQLVAWSCAIVPVPGLQVLRPFPFLLLCLSTLFIAAGGYIINDYFDIRIDVINKPDKVILERIIPRKQAIIVHSLLNILAILLAAMLAIPAGHPEWLLLQVFCTALLWRYSTHWKRQFMIGNVAVSLMTALTIVVLILYEPALHGATRSLWVMHRFQLSPMTALATLAFFAFILTWMREIVKDMEDFKGDDAEGCVTMPIRWGLLASSRFVQVLGVLAILVLLAALTWLAFQLRHPWLHVPLYFILGTVVVPLGIWCWRLPRRSGPEHYHLVSTRLKEIMIFGVLCLAILTL